MQPTRSVLYELLSYRLMASPCFIYISYFSVYEWPVLLPFSFLVSNRMCFCSPLWWYRKSISIIPFRHLSISNPDLVMASVSDSHVIAGTTHRLKTSPQAQRQKAPQYVACFPKAPRRSLFRLFISNAIYLFVYNSWHKYKSSFDFSWTLSWMTICSIWAWFLTIGSLYILSPLVDFPA